MSELSKKIAQLLMLGFAGTELEPEFADFIRDYGLGGALLFDYDLPTKRRDRNIKSIAQVRALNQAIRAAAMDAAMAPLIAIDYEGGRVDRLKSLGTCMETLNALQMAALDDKALAAYADEMAMTLQALGFDLNFAPVVDLNLNPEQGIIGALQRSFSADPGKVARVATIFTEVFAKRGIASCYKHFPGHGSASLDSHKEFVDVTASFQSQELEPYRDLAKRPAAPVMVMTAHVINRALDPSGLPATLSKPVLTDLLREQLGFKGIIISDDLQMKAIADHYGWDQSLAATLNAGADMIIVANQLGQISPLELVQRIEGLVASGLVAEARIEEAYQRVKALKASLLSCTAIAPAPNVSSADLISHQPVRL